MDKQKLMEWLDLQARLQKESKENQYFDKELDIQNMAVRSDIHLENAQLIVNLLEIPYTANKWECKGATAIEITFRWNGVVFFSLENYEDKGEV